MNKQGRGIHVKSGMFSFTYTKEMQGYAWVLSWSASVIRTLDAALKASQVALIEEGTALVKLKVTP